MSSGSETPSNRRTSRITSYLQVGTLLSCAFLLFGEHISYPLTDATRSVTYRLLLSDRPEGTEMSMELPEPIAAYFPGRKSTTLTPCSPLSPRLPSSRMRGRRGAAAPLPSPATKSPASRSFHDRGDPVFSRSGRIRW